MCKVHKEGYLLRLVISMLNSPEYKLAKYLDSFVKPNMPISFSCDSTDLFLDNLKAFSINPPLAHFFCLSEANEDLTVNLSDFFIVRSCT